MRDIVKRSIVFFFVFSFLVYGLTLTITSYLLTDLRLLYEPSMVVVFLCVATLLVVWLVGYIHQLLPDKSGYAFLALGLLKMLVSVVFLIPLIKMEEADKIPTTLFFFACYFLFLLAETIFVVRIINRKSDS